MKAILLLLPALLLPLAPAGGQLLNQDPAANSQPPPTTMQGDRAGPPSRPRGAGDSAGAPSSPRSAADSGGSPGDSPPVTEPPRDRVIVPAPAVPGATRPDSSAGVSDLGRSPIPDRPGARPDASTTAPLDRR